MEIRFHGLRLTKRLVTISCASITLALGMHFALGVALWQATLVSFSAFFLALFVIVASRLPKYFSFLRAIGESISRKEFHKHEGVVSLVPFNGHPMTCFARIEGDNLLFGRAKNWRSIPLDKIRGVSLFEYAGFEIASLDVINNQGLSVSLCIPWSKTFEDQVEIC